METNKEMAYTIVFKTGQTLEVPTEYNKLIESMLLGHTAREIKVYITGEKINDHNNIFAVNTDEILYVTSRAVVTYHHAP